jgi:Serine carboxypeptidase
MNETLSLMDYINREDVRDAFHVPAYLPAYRDSYEDLTYLPNFEGSAWIYELFSKYDGYKMLHLMGDADGILSMRGFWKWIGSMKKQWPVSQAWTPWVYEYPSGSSDLFGFSKKYHDDKIALVTIHGEGHSGLLTKIFRSSTIVRNFIFDKDLFDLTG